jgi:hypothetical protein
MSNNVLFIGNGINYILSEYDWDKLVKNLSDELNTKSFLYDQKDSFPLAYEELYFKANNTKTYREKRIKEFIAKDVKKLKPSKIHEQIVNCSITEIITSNYDYTIQKVKISNVDNISNESNINETKFSLFRYNLLDEKRIWHIHGEINKPDTITLGYEHYAGSLQKLRTLLTKGGATLHKKLKNKSIINRLKGNFEIISWADLFFVRDIHIVGLRLDFEEIDLWWLITYRARKIIEKVPIKNKIYYYIPNEYINTAKSKIELLKAAKVEVIPIDINHCENYYTEVLSRIT